MTENKCIVVRMQISGPVNKQITQLASHCFELILLGSEFYFEWFPYTYFKRHKGHIFIMKHRSSLLLHELSSIAF